MNHMKEVAQILGVKIGEEFHVDKGYPTWNDYGKNVVFTEDGKFEVVGAPYYCSDDILINILYGRLEVFKLPKPILDEKEKEYLSNLIKPYRNRVKYIFKYTCEDDDYEVVSVSMRDHGYCDYKNFPKFKKGSMYKNMELNKEYAMWELGLAYE